MTELARTAASFTPIRENQRVRAELRASLDDVSACHGWLIVRERRPATGTRVPSHHPVRRSERADDPLTQLTDREREVLAVMAEGRSNTAIARRLSVTEHTVEKHIKNILGTLCLPRSRDDHRRVLAVLTYIRAALRPAESSVR